MVTHLFDRRATIRLVVAAAVLFTVGCIAPADPTSRDAGRGGSAEADATLAFAFEQQQSNLQVEGAGVVVRVLRDDLSGGRHERFILQLTTDQTLLVAHNIDLAPRLVDVQVGDEVAFFGEYEWNPQGGVLHWTHHDPAGRHVDGWLRHADRIYQ